MASLQKKVDCWYCQFVYKGQRRTWALGPVEEIEARAIKGKVEYLLMRLKQHLLAVPSGMDIVTFLQYDGKPPESASPSSRTDTSLAKVRDEYLRVFGQGAIEASTLRTIKVHLGHVSRTLGDQFSLGALLLADLQRHVDRRQAMVVPVTIRKEIETLRLVYNWGLRMGYVQGEFPRGKLAYPKENERLPWMTLAEVEQRLLAAGDAELLWECVYLTLPEIEPLLDYVHQQDQPAWIYPAFVFVAHTGARKSEMMRARTEDIQGGIATIREKKRVRGKTTTRRVPLSNRLTEALAPLIKPRSVYLFGNGHKPMWQQAAQKAFDRTLAGSQWANLRGWHVLRHSFISALASKGVDQRIIDSFVGHQTEEQRRRYRHLYPSSQREAIRSVFG